MISEKFAKTPFNVSSRLDPDIILNFYINPSKSAEIRRFFIFCIVFEGKFCQNFEPYDLFEPSKNTLSSYFPLKIVDALRIIHVIGTIMVRMIFLHIEVI